MFRLPRDKAQRIPVLWIPSTSRTIPVAAVSRQDISVDFGNVDLDHVPAEEFDRIFFLEDAILSKDE